MIRAITRAVYRRGLRALERGDLDGVLAVFSPRCTLTFVGETPLGAHLSTPTDIRRWFERFRRLLPNRGVHATTQAASERLPNVKFEWRVRVMQSLCIRIHSNKFHSFNLSFYHPVQSLATSAANSNNLNVSNVL